jgi:uncharacterized protein Yka (UPF0111/DUF47 family)
MKALFRDFLTNRALFFDQFDLAAKNLVEMASLLQSIVETSNPEDIEAIYKHIDKKENIGDDITHKIHLYLNKIVFTPLNKPDIHALASVIDDVADAIHETTGKMLLYNINEFSQAIKQNVDFIAKATIEIEKAILLLRVSKMTAELPALCRQIKNYERQAEQVYFLAVADLFLNDKDAFHLIKYREILFSLETAVNKCKSTADVLEVIFING